MKWMLILGLLLSTGLANARDAYTVALKSRKPCIECREGYTWIFEVTGGGKPVELSFSEGLEELDLFKVVGNSFFVLGHRKGEERLAEIHIADLTTNEWVRSELVLAPSISPDKTSVAFIRHVARHASEDAQGHQVLLVDLKGSTINFHVVLPKGSPDIGSPYLESKPSKRLTVKSALVWHDSGDSFAMLVQEGKENSSKASNVKVQKVTFGKSVDVTSRPISVIPNRKGSGSKHVVISQVKWLSKNRIQFELNQAVAKRWKQKTFEVQF